MSDLIEFHNHARARADWQPGDKRAACKTTTASGKHSKPADHANCGGHQCGCECHAPSDAERQLWRTLAGEIDAYLSDDEDQPMFETMGGGA